MKIILSTVYLITLLVSSYNALKVVQDEELMNLIRSQTYVIVLFSSKDCETCDTFESALNNLEEELSKTFSKWIVKTMNSQLTRLYSPTKEPILVFMRHGIPLLYNGPPNEDLILHTFLNSKEPVVKELTDQTFEHLTQAATGATTGDWFVMFYTPDCIDCNRLVARWESVGAQLKTRMNVARVNKAGDGSATATRFGVSKVPTFILFRQGKMYRYHIQKYDVESFISFAQDWYKNMKPERVPVPKSPFDEFVENIVNNLQQNAWLWQISLLITTVGIILFVAINWKKGSSQKQKSQSKKENKDK